MKGKNGHKNLLLLTTYVDSGSPFTLVGILSLTIKNKQPSYTSTLTANRRTLHMDIFKASMLD